MIDKSINYITIYCH